MPSLTTIANSAARDLGIMDSGGSLSAAQLADALTAANEILDNWSIDGKTVLSELLTSFSLVAATNSYTIGLAQTIAIARPARVNAAQLILTSGPSMPVKVLQSVTEWDAIEDRDSSSYLTKFLFYDRGHPTGKIYVSPKPLGGASIEIATWVPLTQFSDVTTSITLLPGYELPLRLTLAHKLAPEYNMPFSKEATERLAMAVASLESLNVQHWSVAGPAAVAA